MNGSYWSAYWASAWDGSVVAAVVFVILASWAVDVVADALSARHERRIGQRGRCVVCGVEVRSGRFCDDCQRDVCGDGR